MRLARPADVGAKAAFKSLRDCSRGFRWFDAWSLLIVATALAGCAAQPPPEPAVAPRRRRSSGGAGSRRRRRKPRSAPSASTPPGMDRSVAPGDDFYAFANGTWAKNTPIPADKSNYGMFTMLAGPQPAARPRHARGGQGRSEQQDRHRLRQLPRRSGGRSQGPCADRAVARRDPGAEQPRRLCRAVGQGRAQRHRRPVRRRRRPG